MPSEGAPHGARIITLHCDPALLVAHHARSHAAAEYLAAVSATAGPDSAMAARELSAALFEVFEWMHHQPPEARFAVRLYAVHGGVRIEATLPFDPAEAKARMASLAPTDDGRDPLVEPAPGDGLRELAAVHGVGLAAATVDGGLRLTLDVPLGDADDAPTGEHGEATGER